MKLSLIQLTVGPSFDENFKKSQKLINQEIITNIDLEFEKKYFDILVKNSQYLKTHPLNCKVNEFNKIIEVLKKIEEKLGDE